MSSPGYFDESLQKLKFLYQCAGLTVERNKMSTRVKLQSRLVYAFNFFWLGRDTLGAILWMIDGIRSGKTFVEVTYVAPCVIFCFLADLKTIFLIYYDDKICDLIDNLRKLECKHRGDPTTDDIRSGSVKFLHSVLKCSKVLNVTLVFIFVLTPLFLIMLKYMRTGEVELLLPFRILYPIDAQDIRYWPFVYLHQFWSVCIVLLNICGSDYLLYICCSYLGIQFNLLHHAIENMIEEDHVLLAHELVMFQAKCLKLIKWHQDLIRLSDMLEFIYAKSTLFNFVFSSLLICCTGFNVIAMDNVAFVMTFLVFLSACLVQIFMICFFGDILMKSSMDVGNAVYNCKWYYVRPKSGKDLLIMHTRAQKPCKLTAFRFSDVSLKSFISILSSAWSYFALLKTVYNPPRD